MPMTKSSVLIVDDEPDIRELLAMTLAKMDLQCVTAADVAEAKKCLREHTFFLCLADMNLPDGDGLELVEFIQQNNPDLPVAVITAYGNVDGAVNTLKAGAFDYVSKPINLDMLRDLVKTALQLANKKSFLTKTSTLKLIGKSPSIIDLNQKINKIARNQAPVFITGPSGCGKELVAHLIHEQGGRSDKPFIPINCGAIPADLMESEFFGHKKGSFTGALQDKKGLFQAAQGGTLFLDEVADLPLHMQVKLLRAIQEKAVKPIGESREIPVDVRILSASHKDLTDLIEEGKFRQDLFYRINVIELGVPSLADRISDIPLIAEHLLARLSKRNNVNQLKLTSDAMDALKRYDYPGNVRELENILERALTLSQGDHLDANDLGLPNSTSQKPQPQTKSTGVASVQLNDYLNSQEKQAIQSMLDKHKWNRTAAAKELGLTLRALRYRLKKLGLD